jgi:hypothetical protein
LNYWKISFGCLAGLMLAVASCGHPGGGGGGSGGNNGSGGSGSCNVGTLGCACNGTSCDNGLVCATDLNQCVTTGSGSGGSTASGGDTGSGGAVSSGGDTGAGGAAGSGGAASSGGATGSGGAVSSGGTTGSGGSATGGSTGSGGSSAGPNLVANGDFSQGDTNWHFENGTANVSNGQYCETNTGSNALFGWQSTTTPLMLSGSQMYTLTYKGSGSGGAAIHVKVAHAVSPYTPDDYETSQDDQLTGSPQTFTHAFKPGQGDDSNTGIAFFVTGGQNICISSVSLVAN